MTGNPDFKFESGNYVQDDLLDDPQYLLSDVARAAEIKVSLVKSWVSREPRVILFGPFDRPSLGKGSARVFTLRRVICVALTAELVRLGLTASRAGTASFAFTDANLPFDAGSASPLKGEGDWLIVAYPG